MAEGFYDRVYRIVAGIPAGRVATYGQIALLAGSPRASRAVGEAMRRCPFEEIPCHRVLNRRGELAPAPAFGGRGVQRGLLEAEGVKVDEEERVDLRLYQWDSIPANE